MATNFTPEIYTGVNTGVINTTTASLDIRSNVNVCIHVLQTAGNITGAVTILQCSTDDTNWFDVSGSTVNGQSLTDGLSITTQFVRAKVTTASSVGSTATIEIQAK